MVSQDLEYRQGEATFQGFLIYDTAYHGSRPGIVIFHDERGLGFYEKARAQQLASMGYVVFAADVYGKGIRPQTLEAVRQETDRLAADRVLMRLRANAALSVLKSLPEVDPRKIAALGYGFGGLAALELARSGADLAGVAVFYGRLDASSKASERNIKGKVLVLTGADDPYIPWRQVTAFQEEMRQAGVDWQLIVYGGAVHGFANPDAGYDKAAGAAYDRQIDKRSFVALKYFLTELFED